MNRCGTCRHWAKGAQARLYSGADPERGNCDRIKGDDDYDASPEELALANSTEGLGGAWIETLADFGCVLWERRTP